MTAHKLGGVSHRFSPVLCALLVVTMVYLIITVIKDSYQTPENVNLVIYPSRGFPTHTYYVGDTELSTAPPLLTWLGA